jgi:hypothetical protein
VKLLFQTLIFLLTWLTTFANAPPPAQKLAPLHQETTLKTQEPYFARSKISTRQSQTSFSPKKSFFSNTGNVNFNAFTFEQNLSISQLKSFNFSKKERLCELDYSAREGYPTILAWYNKIPSGDEFTVYRTMIEDFPVNKLAALEADFANPAFRELAASNPWFSHAWLATSKYPLIRTNGSELLFVEDYLLSSRKNFDQVADEITDAGRYATWKVWVQARVFNHVPTSGALITNYSKQGTFLVGSYPTDLQYILVELNYPKIQIVDFAFPVPVGQKFNLLNISDEQYNYWAANGGFFTKVNGPWIDAAVLQNADIIVVSKMETLYNSPGVLSGFGKEIHRLEWKHGYRFDPNTKMMVPPSKANGLPTTTLQSEYTH